MTFSLPAETVETLRTRSKECGLSMTETVAALINGARLAPLPQKDVFAALAALGSLKTELRNAFADPDIAAVSDASLLEVVLSELTHIEKLLEETV